MNRREAIRKLGTGGAVAFGASAVLSSRDVAFAASPPDTGLVGVPSPGAPLPFVFAPASDGSVNINATTAASCAAGGSPTVTYAWKVNGFSFSGGNRHLIVRSNGQVLIDTTGSSGYSSAGTGYGTINLAKANNGSKGKVKPLGSSDVYNVSVLVTWQCGGANSALEAEYVITGTGTMSPSAANSAWNVI